MAVTEIFAKACKIEVPTTGLVSDPGDDDDVPGNPVGVSVFSQPHFVSYHFILLHLMSLHCMLSYSKSLL